MLDTPLYLTDRLATPASAAAFFLILLLFLFVDFIFTLFRFYEQFTGFEYLILRRKSLIL